MAVKTIPLHEIISRLEAGEDLEEIEITLFPPDDGQQTDEESGEENEVDLDHLPRNILRSEVEVTLGAYQDETNIESDTNFQMHPADYQEGKSTEELSGLLDESCTGGEANEGEKTNHTSKPAEKEQKKIKIRKKKLLMSSEADKCIKTQPASNSKSYETRGKVKRIGNDDEEIPQTEVEARRKGSQAPKPKKKKTDGSIMWMGDENTFTNRVGNADKNERYSMYCGPQISCVEWFETLFSDDIISLIRDQSNLYALQNNHTPNVTSDEIKVFIGILLLTGYMTPKYMRMLWETQSDTHNSLVSSSMRRNRFMEIEKYLHLADNCQLDPNDKFCKVRAYLNLLNSNFLSKFEIIGASHVSVDETMVPYYGRHSSKQHIHGKPIKFGFKVWSAATKSGYLITFHPYEGSTLSKLPLQEELGLGAAVVLELLSRLPEEYGPYNVYFDRFFGSVKLIQALSSKNIGGTGTVLENRTGKCPLEDSKSLSKKERGSISYKNTKDYIIVKWNDNSIVTLVSNCHGIKPVTKVDRVGTVDKKRTRITVSCPNLTKMYNKYMGGVDRFDQNLDSLRIAMKGRKWWWKLFAFGIDAACQNAWQLKKHADNDSKFTYCDFRRAVVQEYCYKYGTPAQRSELVKNVPKKPQGASRPSHKLENCHEHRRCGHCHKRTRKLCKTCNIGLHIHCSYEYHLNH